MRDAVNQGKNRIGRSPGGRAFWLRHRRVIAEVEPWVEPGAFAVLHTDD
jgi:hypothetical protein